MNPRAAPAPPTTTRSGRKWFWWVIRILGTGLAFGYVVSIVEPQAVAEAMGRTSPFAFVAACIASALNLAVGALRWRLLLSAYGAEHLPHLLRTLYIYWVGYFYNNFLPGGVGGDLVRGLVTRQAFGAQGAAASVTVVLVERVLGLCGLLLIVTVTFLIRPLEGVSGVLPLGAAGIAIAVCAVASVAVGKRLSPYLPGRLGETAASLPVIRQTLPFAAALGLSLVTQLMVALTGFILLDSIAPQVTLGDALVLVPLGMAATFVPFSVGGAGVRETAFIYFFTTTLGLEEQAAVAASLMLWFSQLVVAAFGGLAQLVRPLQAAAT